MPTYEFRCPLGHEFEKFYRSIGTAEAQAACPDCGKLSERMMSAGAGLVFKGSGFYLTDYGKNAHQKKGTETKADGSKAEGSSGDGGKESGKSESAAATGGEGAKSGGSEPAKSESSKPESKSAEAKPAAPPPKSSSGE